LTTLTDHGDGSVTLAGIPPGFAVEADATYDGQAAFYTNGTSRAARVALDWLDANGALLSSSLSASVNDGDPGALGPEDGAHTAEVSATPPPGAAYLLYRLIWTAPSVEVHWFDRLGLFKNAAADDTGHVPWTRGGYDRESLPLLVERRELGGTWSQVRASLVSKLTPEGWGVVYDYEARPDTLTAYRARVVSDVELSVASPPSAEVEVTPSLDAPWLKDPLAPERNVRLSCLDSITPQRSRGGAVLQPLGAKFPVVQSEVRHGSTFTVGVTPITQAEHDALDTLLDAAGRVLLLQRAAATEGWRGFSSYLVVTGDDTDTPLGQVPDDRSTLSFTATEVAAPAVA
jgi:hypothetical protein